MKHRALLVFTGALMACAPRADVADSAKEYVYLWTASADTTAPDFLAVVDVTTNDLDTARYGRLVTTLPVPGVMNRPHHTEHEMPADKQLFANGFGSGQTFIFDLTRSEAPRIEADFGDVDGYEHPHSFLRLPNGNVLATFQMKHADEHVRTGGLVELTPGGALVRSSSADSPGADSGLRVYSGSVVQSIDRIVTTSTDMEKDFFEPSRTVQLWRLSDLRLMHTITLPGENGILSAEPRVLQDGRTVLVSTFSCGLFVIDSADASAPTATQVAAFPQKEGTSCAVPAVVGHYYLVTVPAWNAVVSLDISNPHAPKEVSRVAFDSTDVPHWLSVSPNGKRVVVTGYATMKHTAHILQFDGATGRLTRDARFRDVGATTGGFRMDNKTWPHGGNAKGIPHGAVFSRP
ncbi:MAG: hypothetical protein IT353_15140 [Gemmatimonadaceae bacterium]|nr:hypothetical protein [Gemmatimonadaceae bacterium]